MEKGKFIVFEGVDGAGKTTQLQLLSKRLLAAGYQLHLTKEPTDGPVGSIVRNVLNKRVLLDEKTMAALYLADRLDHIQKEQQGMLHYQLEGQTVISDRYYLSSYAYHSAHVSLDWIIDANSICADLMRPDIIFFLDIEPALSMERIRANRSFADLYETEERLTIVRKNYYQAIERVGAAENIVIVDAAATEQIIADKIWEAVLKIL